MINPDFCRVSGHIGISVPDVDAACKLFEKEKVTFVKKPDSGESSVRKSRLFYLLFYKQRDKEQ